MLLHAGSQLTKTVKIDSKIDIDIDDTDIPSVSTTLIMFYHGMGTFTMCTTKLCTKKNVYLLQKIKQFKLFTNPHVPSWNITK